MRIIHISDIHVPPEGPDAPRPWHGGWRVWAAQLELQLLRRASRFKSAGAVLGRIGDEIRGHVADHVILSGDLTGLALDQEFESARRALGDLVADPERITLIPGNHDRYTPKSGRDRRFERHFGDLLHSEMPEYTVHGRYPLVRFVGDEVAVVGLDSALVPIVPGLAYGRIGRAQLAALEAILVDRRLQGRTVVVTAHHAPYRRGGRREVWTHNLRDADALLDVLARHRVAAFLHGHVHAPFRMTCPRTGVEIVNAGSSTEQGRESYWILDVHGGRLHGAELVRVALEPEPVPLLPATA